MNINVQGSLWACKAIWFHKYKEITLKHFGKVVLRLESKVNLMSAGQIESRVDGGWEVSGRAQAQDTGNIERFAVSYTYRKPQT